MRQKRASLVRLLAIAGIVLFFTSCGSGSAGGSCGRYDDCDYSDYESDEIDADPADVSAQDVESPNFDNCTDDCSGHDAGFEWAQENDVTSSSECGGDSQSFTEGCESFAEQRLELAEEEAQENFEDESYEEAADDY